MGEQYQDKFFDLLGILSFVIGLQNLNENREQSKHNDVQAANDKQANLLLKEINRRFDEQNEILEEQNKVLKQLLELLGENSNED